MALVFGQFFCSCPLCGFVPLLVVFGPEVVPSLWGFRGSGVPLAIYFAGFLFCGCHSCCSGLVYPCVLVLGGCHFSLLLECCCLWLGVSTCVGWCFGCGFLWPDPVMQCFYCLCLSRLLALLLQLLILWLGGWLTSSLVCFQILFGDFVLVVSCSLCFCWAPTFVALRLFEGGPLL